MATRQTTEQRQRELINSLRKDCRSGRLEAGRLVPPVRELSVKYELSVGRVSFALRSLVEEGVLYTVPRVGTFVGQPQSNSPEYYVFLFDDPDPCNAPEPPPFISWGYRILEGFEDYLSRVNAVGIAMDIREVIEHQQQGTLINAAGIFTLACRSFDVIEWFANDSIPKARFSNLPEHGFDTVSFDDVQGGQRVTEHLLQMGHRRIAFIGLHEKNAPRQNLLWSVERERGWQNAMQNAGYSTRGLAIHPPANPLYLGPRHVEEIETATAQNLADAFLEIPGATAVVTANAHVALGLLQVLQKKGVSSERWPVIVSFDDDPRLSGHRITSMRLEWNEIGRMAAEMLWKRQHHKELKPHHQSVAMRLIPRLTTRPEWPQQARYATAVAG